MKGWELIQAERQRQIEKEDWTAEHDAHPHPEDLKRAAECYVIADGPDAMIPAGWPWAAKWWKPKDRQRNLERAGALYLAAADLAVSMGKHVMAKGLKDNALRCAHSINQLPFGPIG